MAKLGRPPWIPSKENIREVEDLAARGLTQEQIADCIGIGTSTLFDKKNHYPDLADAIKRGKSKGIAIIANTLFEHAVNGNITAQIFYLKTRAGWREEDKKELPLNPEEAIRELG